MVRKTRTNRSTAVSIVRTPVSTAITIPSRIVNNVNARSRRSRSRRPRGQALAGPVNICQPYIRTLNDPFEHGPTRLGWGTMVPTGLGTCFYRGFCVVPSTGNFAIYCEPGIYLYGGISPIAVNIDSAGGTTWSGSDWQNKTAFNGLASEIRPVSIGLKALPMVAQTATPGLLYTGSIEGLAFTALRSQTATSLINSPYLTPGYGMVGACASGRPVDPSSFIFSNNGIVPTSNPITPMSIPVIVGNGFPVGTTVFYEAVFNFEYIYATTMNGSAAANPLESGLEMNDQSTMTRVFNNVESMWNTVKRYLEPTGVFGAISDIASRGVNAAARMLLPSPVNRLLTITPAVSISSSSSSQDDNFPGSPSPRGSTSMSSQILRSANLNDSRDSASRPFRLHPDPHENRR